SEPGGPGRRPDTAGGQRNSSVRRVLREGLGGALHATAGYGDLAEPRRGRVRLPDEHRDDHGFGADEPLALAGGPRSSSGHERVGANEEPPLRLDAHAHSNTTRRRDRVWLRRRSLFEPHGGASDEVGAVETPIDRESSAELPRTRAEIHWAPASPNRGHLGCPFDRFERPQQDPA